MNNPDKQKIADAIAAFAKTVKDNPVVVNCSMCGGMSKFEIEKERLTWRCEGSGQCGHFAIQLD